LAFLKSPLGTVLYGACNMCSPKSGTVSKDIMIQLLYGVEHEDGSWTYAADKEWRGSDVCEAAAGLLGQCDLVPDALGDGEPMEAAGEATEERVVPTARLGTSSRARPG
jgi:hypothetical protein